MKRALVALALLASTASTTLAGASYVGVQLSHGIADLAALNTIGQAEAYDHPEMGVKLEYWNMLREDYAFNGAYTFGFFSEENESGPLSAPGAGTFKYSQSSWSIRIGGDRVVKVGERSALYFGPGLEYWSGKAKFDASQDNPPPDPPVYETQNTNRISFVARIGAHMMFNEAWGFTFQTGYKAGRASIDEQGSKSTWWPTSMDAAGGLVLRFGND